MKQRHVSFTLTAQRHVEQEEAWWLTNRDHPRIFAEELEQALINQAQQRQMELEELVREALLWYLQLGAATLDEFAAWQEVRDEAARHRAGGQVQLAF